MSRPLMGSSAIRRASSVLASVASVVVTRGTESVTVIVSFTCPGARRGANSEVRPVSSASSVSHAFMPGASTRTRYRPMFSGGVRKKPSPLDSVDVTTPVARCMAVTLARGTAAPATSFTVP